MENATKALIIAGAILVSLLLVSMGILLLNNSDQLTSTAQGKVDSMDVQAFNSNFNVYLGNRVSGSQVIALFDLVRTLETTEPDRQVEITGLTAGDIRTSWKYIVTITDWNTDGYVTEINVEQNTGSN